MEVEGGRYHTAASRVIKPQPTQAEREVGERGRAGKSSYEDLGNGQKSGEALGKRGQIK